MTEDNVDDLEVLYRRAPVGRKLYSKKIGGSIRFSSQLFSDKHKKASVDRAKLCDNNPHYTQQDTSDGVISFTAHEIRKLPKQDAYDGKKVTQSYVLDVVPDPILPGNTEGSPPNPAHAVIPSVPHPPSSGVYRRILESLAQFAERLVWTIEPTDWGTIPETPDPKPSGAN